ncbi:molybdenum cofactor guanylyltransferase [Leucobacter sp. GX24907]
MSDTGHAPNNLGPNNLGPNNTVANNLGPNSTAAFDAVILAGGRGSRLGGIDKASVELGGARLLDRVVAAARRCGARRVVVVGPERAPDWEARPDAVLREDPPFGGPLPALAAGLTEVRAEWLMLLPCDLEDPDRLCARLHTAWRGAALGGAHDEVGDAEQDHARDEADAHAPCDGVRLVDGDGRPQWLAGIYRTQALRRGIAAAVEAGRDPASQPPISEAPAAQQPAEPAAEPVGSVLANFPLRVAFGQATVAEVTASDDVVADIDTPEDLERARSRADWTGATRPIDSQ